MTTAYQYRASTAEGRVVEGVVQATLQPTALEELRRQRLYPIDVAPVSAVNSSKQARSLNRSAALALFARTVSTMLGAGVPLERALAFAAQQARHPELAKAARAAHHDLQGGAAFSEAVSRQRSVFPPLFVAMVAAGEESGALDDAMSRLADHLEELSELRGQIRSALLYPALMGIVSGAGITILLLFVVPRFADLLGDEGVALPVSTQILVALSRIVVDGWWLIGLVLVSAVLIVRRWLHWPDNRRQFHRWRLRWPVAGDLELKYATARFTRALGMLLASGRPVLDSMRAARITVSNLALGESLENATDAVAHGQRLNSALAGSLPPLATELVAVGEESGRLDELCLRIADSYDSEVKRTLRAAVGIIEPVLIVVFGLIVGFIALALLQAIYGLSPASL